LLSIADVPVFVTSLAISAIFLELNGFSLDAPEPESVIVTKRLAAGDLSEPGFAKWLGDSSIHSREQPRKM